MTYLFMAYSILVRGEVVGISPFPARRVRDIDIPNRGVTPSSYGGTQLDILLSPLMLLFLMGGLLSTIGGISLWSITRKKEIREVENNLKDILLTEEEKQIIKELEDASEELTQRELTERTGFSRVKIHRVISKLESKKLIKKYPYGQTNKIILEK